MKRKHDWRRPKTINQRKAFLTKKGVKWYVQFIGIIGTAKRPPMRPPRKIKSMAEYQHFFGKGGACRVHWKNWDSNILADGIK